MTDFQIQLTLDKVNAKIKYGKYKQALDILQQLPSSPDIEVKKGIIHFTQAKTKVNIFLKSIQNSPNEYELVKGLEQHQQIIEHILIQDSYPTADVKDRNLVIQLNKEQNALLKLQSNLTHLIENKKATIFKNEEAEKNLKQKQKQALDLEKADTFFKQGEYQKAKEFYSTLKTIPANCQEKIDDCNFYILLEETDNLLISKAETPEALKIYEQLNNDYPKFDFLINDRIEFSNAYLPIFHIKQKLKEADKAWTIKNYEQAEYIYQLIEEELQTYQEVLTEFNPREKSTQELLNYSLEDIQQTIQNNRQKITDYQTHLSNAEQLNLEQANAYFQKGRYRQAKELFQTLNPTEDIQKKLSKINLYLKLGEIDELLAIHNFEEAQQEYTTFQQKYRHQLDDTTTNHIKQVLYFCRIVEEYQNLLNYTKKCDEIWSNRNFEDAVARYRHLLPEWENLSKGASSLNLQNERIQKIAQQYHNQIADKSQSISKKVAIYQINLDYKKASRFLQEGELLEAKELFEEIKSNPLTSNKVKEKVKNHLNNLINELIEEANNHEMDGDDWFEEAKAAEKKAESIEKLKEAKQSYEEAFKFYNSSLIEKKIDRCNRALLILNKKKMNPNNTPKFNESDELTNTQLNIQKLYPSIEFPKLETTIHIEMPPIVFPSMKENPLPNPPIDIDALVEKLAKKLKTAKDNDNNN